MGDAPSLEEKLHLITRNLQVGPWDWNAPLGTGDSSPVIPSPAPGPKCVGPRSPRLGGFKVLC